MAVRTGSTAYSVVGADGVTTEIGGVPPLLCGVLCVVKMLLMSDLMDAAMDPAQSLTTRATSTICKPPAFAKEKVIRSERNATRAICGKKCFMGPNFGFALDLLNEFSFVVIYNGKRCCVIYANLDRKKRTSPKIATTAPIIQNRIVTWLSGHPNASKWW